MTLLPLSEIETFVRARLDEVANGDAGFVNADSLNIANAVRRCAETAIRNIHLIAPNVLLDGIRPDNNMPTCTVSNGVGTFKAPAEFMRLVSMRFNGWDIPVQTLINEDSVEYRKQRNKFLRGTPRHPVAAITHASPDNGFVIEAYTVGDHPTLADFRYVPEIKITDDKISICPKLKQSCLYAVTAEVARCFGDERRAQTFEALSRQQLNPTADDDRIYPANGEKTIES